MSGSIGGGQGWVKGAGGKPWSQGIHHKHLFDPSANALSRSAVLSLFFFSRPFAVDVTSLQNTEYGCNNGDQLKL